MTTRPPDTTLVAFVRDVELAAVALYGRVAPRLHGPSAVAAAGDFVRHHAAHARLLADFAAQGDGRIEPSVAQAVNAEFAAATSEAELLAALETFERRLAATHQDVLRRCTGTDAVHTLAAIQPVEMAHAAFYAVVAGKSPRDAVPAGLVPAAGSFLSPALSRAT